MQRLLVADKYVYRPTNNVKKSTSSIDGFCAVSPLLIYKKNNSAKYLHDFHIYPSPPKKKHFLMTKLHNKFNSVLFHLHFLCGLALK